MANKRVLIAHPKQSVVNKLSRIVSAEYIPMQAHNASDVDIFFRREDSSPAVSMLPVNGLGTTDIGTVVSKISSMNRHTQVVLMGSKDQDIGIEAANMGAYCFLDIGANSRDIKPETVQRVLDSAWLRYNRLSARNAERRTLVHDANNHLSVVIGYADILRMDGDSEELRTIAGAGEQLRKLLIKIQSTFVSGASSDEEYDFPLNSIVGESDLTGKKEYVIVHVDDEKLQRDLFYRGIHDSSNIDPPQKGYFGHNGKKVSYELYSADSVRRALEILQTLRLEGKEVDLLVTDREMPDIDGFQLLEMITDGENGHTRKPDYLHVKKLAMLSGGATSDEARQAEVYGAFVPKPVPTASIEPMVYNLINQ